MKKTQPQLPSEVCPDYFKSALQYSYTVLIIFYIIYTVCLMAFGHIERCLDVVPWLLAACLSRYFMEHVHIRWETFFYTVISIGWMSYFIHMYGWSCGGVNFMVPLMIISFFSLYEKPGRKIFFVFALFFIRMALFFYSQNHEPVINLTSTQSLIFQTLNTLSIFVNIAIVCIIFSTNIQKSEKHLMLYNMELRQQAATDPLTTLYNRRKMTEIVNNHIAANPNQTFSIAIGDIDLFKHINDTYGHNCGDQVLKDLSALFREKTFGIGHVCRWGGEEFFFFLPEMNLDQASRLLNDINLEVSRLPILYNNQVYNVTMTFGVEEYDYSSDLTELIRHADDKLYYGKNHGRNQVVF